MPKRRKSSSSDDSSSEYIQLSFLDRLEQDIGLTSESFQKNSCFDSSEELEEIKSLVSNTSSISLKTFDDSKAQQLNSTSVTSDKPGNTGSSSKEGLVLFVPDRFDVLERRAKDKNELKTIIVAVEDALAHLDDTYSDMIAAGRQQFSI